MSDFLIQDGQKFLLIGDSITDWGRHGPMAPLGEGYVTMLRDLVLANWPERNITWINEGISGNRVVDLRDRWDEDVIREAPDWLSIKIGINDLLCYLEQTPESISPAEFRSGYREILTRTKEKLPQTRLLLVSPFYLSTDRSGESFQSQVLNLLPEYLAVVDDMAKEFNTRLVRLQPIFDNQLKYRCSDQFCGEPVHPNRTGHLIIAHEILKALS